jgi:glycosyltransferase involved in cell wall biosynthesis
MAVTDPLTSSLGLTPAAPSVQSAGGQLPLVSVVSVFYNRVQHVRDSVASLLAQTYANLEIIIVDDGSTDGTAEELSRIADPRLTLIRQPNQGFTRAMNTAVRASRGAFVAIHGSGDISYPNRIVLQARLLQSRPEIGIVGALVENEDMLRGGITLRRPKGKGPLAKRLLGATPFTHGEVMFRRELFDRVGGYRDFFTYAQDRDLWLRMSRHTDFAIVEEPLYRRRRLEGAVSTNVESLILQTYLSDFAIQCARSRDDQGRDLVDLYGRHALFLRRRSPALAHRLATDAIRWMVMGEMAGSKRLARVAREEVATPYALFAYAVTHFRLLREPARWLMKMWLRRSAH